MLKKMVSRFKDFKKMESLVMKENHPLATFGGMFVIVLIAKKKKCLRQILRKERKDLSSKNLKKDIRQEIQKLTFLENHLENLTIMFFTLEPENKPFPPFLLVKKI